MTGGDSGYVTVDESGHQHATDAPLEIVVRNGRPADTGPDAPRYAWHEVAVEEFYTNPEFTGRFTGVIRPAEGVAIASDAA